MKKTSLCMNSFDFCVKETTVGTGTTKILKPCRNFFLLFMPEASDIFFPPENSAPGRPVSNRIRPLKAVIWIAIAIMTSLMLGQLH